MDDVWMSMNEREGGYLRWHHEIEREIKIEIEITRNI